MHSMYFIQYYIQYCIQYCIQYYIQYCIQYCIKYCIQYYIQDGPNVAYRRATRGLRWQRASVAPGMRDVVVRACMCVQVRMST